MLQEFTVGDLVNQSVSSAPLVPSPLCTWNIPLDPQQAPLVLDAFPGSQTIFVGANGSGKSALGLWLQRHSGPAKTKRLVSHRRLWMQHAGPDMTSAGRDQQAQFRRTWDLEDDSRWLDHSPQSRPNLLLFDLIAGHNARNDRLARLVDQGRSFSEIRNTVEPSPITRLNTILHRCDLPVQIELTRTGTLDAVRRNGTRYPVSQLSDGERSAMMLAAEVLMAEQGSVQIIDEPERHIHRSISAPLMEAVANERPDCHFAILTHDLDLAYSLVREGASAVSLSRCSWSGGTAAAWDAVRLPEDDQMPNVVREAILGGKRRILFTEGSPTSVDFDLLRLLLPKWMLKPIGGCAEVIRVVKGLRASGDYTWIEAAGVIDRDQRTSDECAALRQDGIFPLGVHEIENLYYAQPILQRLAEAQASTLGRNPGDLLASVREKALASLSDSEDIARLAMSVSDAYVRRHLRESAPTKEDIKAGTNPLVINIDNPFNQELKRLRCLLDDNDLDEVSRRYPVRDTGLPHQVAVELGFRRVRHLQNAARHHLRTDEALLTQIQQIAGPLPT